MSLLPAFVLACAGFATLALAMERHHRQVSQRPAAWWWRLLLRTFGWFVLAASLAACIAYSGWSIGVVQWFGLLSGAALVVSLVLSYRPHWIVLLCPLVLLQKGQIR